LDNNAVCIFSLGWMRNSHQAVQ